MVEQFVKHRHNFAASEKTVLVVVWLKSDVDFGQVECDDGHTVSKGTDLGATHDVDVSDEKHVAIR
jgi:hypothetical protein